MDLPHAYHGPLHILPPLLEQIVTGMFLALLALILIFFFMYFYLNRRQPHTARLEQKPADLLGQLATQTREHGNYRQGCHDLSRIVKAILEQKTGLQIEEMTAQEIEATVTSGGFFLELSKQQYGPLNPDQGAFDRLLQRAKKVVQTGKGQGPRV